MAEKIRVVTKHKDGTLGTFDTVQFDLDKFCKDYRRHIAPLASEGTAISPTEFFWKWLETNKE